MMKKTILFVAANPIDTTRLRLDEEFRSIRAILSRDRFDIIPLFATRIEDFISELLSSNPSIIHLSMHGKGEDGIIFENKTGNSKPIRNDDLVQLISRCVTQTECIVFNACFSEIQAKMLANTIEYVIGMDDQIDDIAAIEFSKAFYEGYDKREDIEFAYNLGCIGMQIAGNSNQLIPTLLRNNNLAINSIGISSQNKTAKPSIKRTQELIGRAPELNRISELAENNHIIGIYGPAGIGKTALIINWAQRAAPEKNMCFHYICINEKLSCDEIISNLLLKFDISKDLSNPDERRHALLIKLATNPGLLVFDNFELLHKNELPEISELLEELALRENLCIIASRKRVSKYIRIGFEIKELSDVDSRNLLRYKVEQNNIHHVSNMELNELCDAVGNLPLAIEIIAPLLAIKPAKNIIKEIKSGNIESLQEITAALDLSYTNLPSEQSKYLLKILGLFPIDIGIQTILEMNIFQEDELSKELANLTSSCLLHLQPNERYQMHAIVRAFAKTKLTEPEINMLSSCLNETYTKMGQKADLWNIQPWNHSDRNEFIKQYKYELSNMEYYIEDSLQHRDKSIVNLAIANQDIFSRSSKRNFIRNTFERILRLWKKELSNDQLGYIFGYLGTIFHRQRELPTAEQYFHDALSYMEQTNNFRFIGFIYIWIGWIWIENQKAEPDETLRREKAMYWYKKAHDIAINHHDTLIELYALHHFGHDLLAKAHKCSDLTKSQLIKKAQSTYEKVIELASENGINERICRSQSALAKLALLEDNYDKSRYFARKSLESALQIGDDRSKAVAKSLFAASLILEIRSKQNTILNNYILSLAEKAKSTAFESLDILDRLGDKGTTWQVYQVIGDAADILGDIELAIWGYSNAVTNYVTSSGAVDKNFLQNQLSALIKKQKNQMDRTYSDITIQGLKNAHNNIEIIENQKLMSDYPNRGLTLVWGLPLPKSIKNYKEKICSLIAEIGSEEFIERPSLCLHATILTLKKIPKEQDISSSDNWPLGAETAFTNILKTISSTPPFQVFFKELVFTPSGEIFLGGFPIDDSLAVLRNNLIFDQAWEPHPWHKGNFHISLGYFSNFIDKEKISRLKRIFTQYSSVELTASIEKLKIVHFAERSLFHNNGYIDIPLGKESNLNFPEIAEFLSFISS
jgi:hypothetical protein